MPLPPMFAVTEASRTSGHPTSRSFDPEAARNIGGARRPAESAQAEQRAKPCERIGGWGVTGPAIQRSEPPEQNAPAVFLLARDRSVGGDCPMISVATAPGLKIVGCSVVPEKVTRSPLAPMV